MKDKIINDLDLLKTKLRIYSYLDFESLHSKKINKNSWIGCYNCLSMHQALTKKDNPKKQNSFQFTSCNGDCCVSHIYQGSYKKVKQILLAENEYMFYSNESNKIKLKKKYITIQEALLLDWDSIDEIQVKQIIRSFPQLNPAIIEKIIAYLNKNPDISLNLSGLTDITLNGIEQFDKLKKGIYLYLDGLSKLTKDAYLRLSKLKKLYSISLDGLKTFDLEDATYLVMNKSLDHISLDRLKIISTDVLFKLLINTNVAWIHLNHLQKITKGQLEFDKIDKEIALNFYAMKHIDPIAGHFFSKLNKKTLLRLDTIDLISVEDAKNLFSNLSCFLVLDGVYAISDEVASEVSKFKGTGYMQNLLLCTDFAIKCFSKTSFSLDIKIDFLFDNTSACFVNKKRDYIDIKKVKYVNEVVAANLAKAKVKLLMLYDLENLSDYSAEILSKSTIEKIGISDDKIINKSALEKFYSNRNPDGTKKENKKFDYTKLTLPCLALVRNLKFEDDENGMGRIEFGDIIKISKIRKDLIALIPEPNPILTRKQLKRLIFREELLDMMLDDFKTLEEVDACPLKEIFMDIDFCKSIDHIVYEMFDKDPYYFNYNMNQYFEQYKIKDRDIFNESYVIGFFVSSNYEANFDYLKAVALSMMKSGSSASTAINHLHYFYLEQMLEGEWNEEMSVQDMFERLNEDLPIFINGIKKLPDDYDYLWDK